jgi:hypothetical protein
MGNDAPAEPIRRIPEEHQVNDKPDFHGERNSLVSGDKDSSYKLAFNRMSNEDADNSVVKQGFRKAIDVANFNGMPEAGRDASDQFQGISETKAVSDYIGTLQRAGFSPAESESIAAKTADRLNNIKDGGTDHLSGTPAEQIARLNKAMTDILDKTGVKDGKLLDGQADTLTEPSDRQNLVQDLASRFSNPDRFVVQGQHLTCALESKQKQFLEGGDMARVAEMSASLVNNGFANVTELNGKVTRAVHVDSDSFRPDKESSIPFDASYHGDQGNRGLSGQVWDALAGQVMADLKSERAGKPTSENGIGEASNVYMAAHSEKYDATTKTGEGLFRKENGNYTLKEDNPGATLWDIAHMNRAMGGHDGAVFAHSNLRGSGAPPEGKGFPKDLTVTTFSSMADLRDKLGKERDKFGTSAQISVDAPFLPGGGADGHGLHAMNISLNKDNTFRLDNNWSKDKDIGVVTDAQVDRATNPDKWLAEGRPTADTVFRPDTGRNPNESVDDFNKRREADTKRKLEEEDEQKKRDEKRKKEEKDAAEKIEAEKERLAKEERELLKLQQDEQTRIKELADSQQRESETQKLVTNSQPTLTAVW